MEAKLGQSSRSFLGEAFPEGSLSLLLTPSGPEREALMLPLLLHGLRDDLPVLAVVSNTSPQTLLAKLATVGGEAEAALKAGRLRILDWYSHKEGEVTETSEEDGILRCPGSLEALEEALTQLLEREEAGAVALLEFLTDATWFGKDKAVDLVTSLHESILQAYGAAVLVVDGDLLAPDTVQRLEGMVDHVVHLRREKTEKGPTWKVSVRQMGEELADHFLTIKPPFVDFAIAAKPEEALEVPTVVSGPADEEKGDGCPECGAALEEGECQVCGYAAKGSRVERVQEILDQCETRLAEDPEDLDALFTKAIAVARLRRYDDAIQTLNQVAKHNPRYPALWMLKAKIYEGVGDDLKAKLCRQRALELEEAEMGSLLAVRVEEEQFQCPLCQRWLPMEASACPCGAEFAEDEGT